MLFIILAAIPYFLVPLLVTLLCKVFKINRITFTYVLTFIFLAIVYTYILIKLHLYRDDDYDAGDWYAGIIFFCQVICIPWSLLLQRFFNKTLLTDHK